jgi:phage terminase large subunit
VRARRGIEGRLRELGLTRKDRIYADSSRPEIIAALRAVGFNVKAAKKGHDSIVAGIDRLKSLPMFVHEDSDDIIVELENYTWQQDRGGSFHSKPIDKFNHAVDAMRYWAIMELQPRSMHGMRRKVKKAKSSLKLWR